MPEAQPGDTVKVHYTGRLGDGTVFDTSENMDPLEFRIGMGEIIPGFEDAVIGMAPGERKTAALSIEQGYGPRHDEMIVQVDRSEFPENVEPTVGQHLEIRQPDGQVYAVRISGVTDDTVELDGNHPLAGKLLIFDIELVAIG